MRFSVGRSRQGPRGLGCLLGQTSLEINSDTIFQQKILSTSRNNCLCVGGSDRSSPQWPTLQDIRPRPPLPTASHSVPPQQTTKAAWGTKETEPGSTRHSKTPVSAQRDTKTLTNIDTHTHIHTHTYIHTHTQTHAFTHTHIHTHTHKQTNTHTLTNKRIHTHTHTHIHTHTHTHTHTPQTHPVHVHPPRCTKTGENPRHPNLSTPRQTGPSTGSSADLSLTSLNLPAPRPGLPGSSYKTSN